MAPSPPPTLWVSQEALLYEWARLAGEGRHPRRSDRLLAHSGLPQQQTVATFQVERLPLAVRGQIERLRAGACVEEATTVVAVGPPGGGKRHVLAAVAHDLVKLGSAVLWTPTAHLIQRWLAAKRDRRVPQA